MAAKKRNQIYHGSSKCQFPPPNIMMDHLSSLMGYYETTVTEVNRLCKDYGDKRVANWFMMGSPWPTVTACLTYTLIMKFVGPKLMENRPAYDLKKFMILYNIFQIFFNLYILLLGVDHWMFHYSYRCQPIDYSMNPAALRMARCCYWFYISKFLDWFDTLFFVLRKKNDHISLLHLVHHSVMPFNTWLGVKFTPGGQSTFFGLLNTNIQVSGLLFFVLRKKNDHISLLHLVHHSVMPFNTWLGVKFTPGGQSTFFGLLNTNIHIIMYFYYTVAALGPKYQKYLWWKKYLTTMQIVQFVLVFLHAAQLLFIDCDYPKIFVYLLMAFTLMFIALFTDFYIKTYLRSGRRNKNFKENEMHANCNGVHTCNLQKLSSKSTEENGLRQRHTRKERPNGMCIQQALFDEL
ncbi:unnamed protein product [Cyprideis torosa]|uniref:Elongation of very long chain fatty acids protein n=1 Tax=Cyprideis torosa TaxID=163714 RepID=A0A7R8WC46_9CRUS|nr:unnamed protein product [Cyprideis torosa]CAG0892981.1 unnamed protein product [Cyprideis torosa]